MLTCVVVLLQVEAASCSGEMVYLLWALIALALIRVRPAIGKGAAYRNRRESLSREYRHIP
jgi:hypothetical protein